MVPVHSPEIIFGRMRFLIASSTSSVTSSQPGSVLTCSRPTTCLMTNCISLMGATYSGTEFLLSRNRGLSLQLRRELRHDLEKVAHKPVVRDLEDRRFRVL